MTVYIYSLFDARTPDLIKYVGKTTNIRARMASHFSALDSATRVWVKQVIRESSVVSCAILRVTDPRGSAQNERECIEAHKGSLLNTVLPAPYSDFESNGTATMREAQIAYAIKILNACSGNKLQAAKVLGIGRQTLYNLLETVKQGRTPTNAKARTKAK